MIKIHLSDVQRKQLDRFRSQASAKDSEKALMVIMSSDGDTVKQIARTLRRNPHTVRDWLKRYQTKGLDGLARNFHQAALIKREKNLCGAYPSSYPNHQVHMDIRMPRGRCHLLPIM